MERDAFVMEDAAAYGPQIGIQDNRKFWHVRLDLKVIQNMRKIGNSPIIAYLALLSFADTHSGVCWPSSAQLEHITGLSRNTLFRALNKLVKLGLIERRQLRKGKEFSSNLYHLCDLTDWNLGDDVSMAYQHMGYQPLVSQKVVHKPDPDLNQNHFKPEPEERKRTQKPENDTPARAAASGSARSLSRGEFSLEFREFWKTLGPSHPRKRNKGDAWRIWVFIGGDARWTTQIQPHLLFYMTTEDWVQCRMLPANWLRHMHESGEFEHELACAEWSTLTWEQKLAAASAAIADEGGGTA